MSASKPGKSAQKRHKVNLPTSKPPAKKVKASSSTKQIPVEKAFEQPSGQPKRIEFKLIEAISNIFESAAYTEATGIMQVSRLMCSRRGFLVNRPNYSIYS